jgi:hypothetical protein
MVENMQSNAVLAIIAITLQRFPVVIAGSAAHEWTVKRMLFNLRAAITCFSVVGMVVCAFFSIFAFEEREEERGAAFAIVAMMFVFISGGMVFA